MCMTTAAIITTVAEIGTGVGGAAIAAHGQTKAAETNEQATKEATAAQSDAAQKALEFQERTYNARQAQVNPYVNMGAGALAALGSGLGVTPGNLPSGAIPMPNTAAPNWLPGTSPTGAKSGYVDPSAMSAMNGMPQGFDLTSEQQRIDAQTQAANAAQSLSASGVRMSSPDGSEQQMVPREQVPYYMSKGAKVVQA